MNLKPCPFCGSREATIQGRHGNRRNWWVQCYDCYACAGACPDRAAAISAWNDRTALAADVTPWKCSPTHPCSNCRPAPSPETGTAAVPTDLDQLTELAWAWANEQVDEGWPSTTKAEMALIRWLLDRKKDPRGALLNALEAAGPAEERCPRCQRTRHVAADGSCCWNTGGPYCVPRAPEVPTPGPAPEPRDPSKACGVCGLFGCHRPHAGVGCNCRECAGPAPEPVKPPARCGALANDGTACTRLPHPESPDYHSDGTEYCWIGGTGRTPAAGTAVVSPPHPSHTDETPCARCGYRRMDHFGAFNRDVCPGGGTFEARP